MPDFEALIRHQQLKQPSTNQRLKVLDSPTFKDTNIEKTKINKYDMFKNFVGGFLGSVIGTFTILFLYINDYLPIDFLRIK
tara:strand:+ start:111 stop:353 length:243 start_codon:yes stop_codon:yes gene_type:complete